MVEQRLQNMTVDHENIASVLMGYNINTGWRLQPDLSILIPYQSWLTFTKMYKHLRPLVGEPNPKEYYLELATAQYNEVLYATQRYKDGTLLLPRQADVEPWDFEEYNKRFSELDLLKSKNHLFYLERRVLSYYKLKDKDIFVPTSVNIKKMSDWNKKLLVQSLSYLLLDDKMYSIERR